jgi:predicted aspartyl protease
MYQFGNLQSKSCACPEASIIIHNPLDNCADDQQGTTVKAIVDTGAEMTVIPESIINSLIGRSNNGFETYPIIMENADGSCRECKTYRLHIAILNEHGSCEDEDTIEHEIEVISLPDKEYALIGRDFLALYRVVLNFESEVWGFCNETNCQIS